MRISAITNHSKLLKSNFKGYMVKNAGPYDIEAAQKTGRRMEEGLSIIRKERIYYADPLEHISDSLKESVDYIVYDDEPRFPDVNYEVSKAYFHPEVENLDENVNDIRKYKDYFYRMEMADRKNVGSYEDKVWRNVDVEDSKAKSAYYKARVSDAQYNQKTAAEFLNILNESHDLRQQNKNNYYNIVDVENKIASWTCRIPIAQKELITRKEVDSILKSKKSALFAQINACKQFINATNQADAINEKGGNYKVSSAISEEDFPLFKNVENNSWDFKTVPSTSKSYKAYRAEFVADAKTDKADIGKLEKVFQTLSEQLKKYNEFEAENKKELDFLQKFIEVAPKEIKELQTLLSHYKTVFEKSKANLIPYFDKLKNYMATHALKTVK